MKHTAVLLLLATLAGCSTLPAPSNPLDPHWTQRSGVALEVTGTERSGDSVIHHINVYNQAARLVSIQGFETTSRLQRDAKLKQLCPADRASPDQTEEQARLLTYRYYWGSHEHHPLLSEFTIEPDRDCLPEQKLTMAAR